MKILIDECLPKDLKKQLVNHSPFTLIAATDLTPESYNDEIVVVCNNNSQGASTMFSYTLGRDIGIASVGWCLLGEDHIIALGVRAFGKAETSQEGESLNLARRNARLMRRRLRRRAWRLTKLARLLKRHEVIDDIRLFQPQNPSASPLWALRVAALDRLLQPKEWARVIYHLCKHRGFHWISRAEERRAEEDLNPWSLQRVPAPLASAHDFSAA